MKKQSPIFRSDTFLSVCSRTPALVPQFLSTSVDFVLTNLLTEVGVFRISGNAELINEMVNEIETTLYLDLSHPKYKKIVFEPADVLKRFFRELSDGLCLSSQFEVWKNVVNDSKVDEEKLKSVIKDMPNKNQYMLQILMFMLRQVNLNSEFNKMNAQNLGIIWGPNLIKRNAKTSEIRLSDFDDFQKYVIEEMICNYNTYFRDSFGPFSPGSLYQKLCNVSTYGICFTNEGECISVSNDGSISFFDLSSKPRLKTYENVFSRSLHVSTCFCAGNIWVSTERGIVVQRFIRDFSPEYIRVPSVVIRNIDSSFLISFDSLSTNTFAGSNVTINKRSAMKRSLGLSASLISSPQVWAFGVSTITILDGITNKVIHTIAEELKILSACFVSSTNSVWVLFENLIKIYNAIDYTFAQIKIDAKNKTSQIISEGNDVWLINDTSFEVISVQTHKIVSTFTFPELFISTCVCVTSRYIWVGFPDGKISILDKSDGKLVGSLSYHTSVVNGMVQHTTKDKETLIWSFSSTGRVLCTWDEKPQPLTEKSTKGRRSVITVFEPPTNEPVVISDIPPPSARIEGTPESRKRREKEPSLSPSSQRKHNDFEKESTESKSESKNFEKEPALSPSTQRRHKDIEKEPALSPSTQRRHKNVEKEPALSPSTQRRHKTIEKVPTEAKSESKNSLKSDKAKFRSHKKTQSVDSPARSKKKISAHDVYDLSRPKNPRPE